MKFLVSTKTKLTANQSGSDGSCGRTYSESSHESRVASKNDFTYLDDVAREGARKAHVISEGTLNAVGTSVRLSLITLVTIAMLACIVLL